MGSNFRSLIRIFAALFLTFSNTSPSISTFLSLFILRFHNITLEHTFSKFTCISLPICGTVPKSSVLRKLFIDSDLD